MLAAKRCATNHNMTKSFAQQALALNFASTVLTAAGGPRTMTVALASPDGSAGRLAAGGGLDLACGLEKAHARELGPEAGRRLALLHSNPPERDAQTGRGWPASLAPWCLHPACAGRCRRTAPGWHAGAARGFRCQLPIRLAAAWQTLLHLTVKFDPACLLQSSRWTSPAAPSRRL
jgi:hypothetical protein